MIAMQPMWTARPLALPNVLGYNHQGFCSGILDTVRRDCPKARNMLTTLEPRP